MDEVNTAIRISNLTKEYYTIKNTKKTTNSLLNLRDIFFRSFIFNKKEKITVLKNINLEIKEGEIVGIIGRNGAGKTTLLSILSEITSPTEGTVEIKDKVISFLDIGVGFDYELSGRDNIFINASLLGFPRKEINKVMDKIIDFSGIRDYIDTPIKYYSKGMFSRLAFSIIVHLEADIYLFDEVMTFGDAEFRKKSFNKLTELISRKKTILLVTHNLNEILLCNRIIYLENGEVKADGKLRDILYTYIDDIYKLISERQKSQSDFLTKSGCCYYYEDDFVKLNNFKVKQNNSEIIYTDNPVIFEIEYELKKAKKLDIIILVNDYNDYPLFVATTVLVENSEIPEHCGKYQARCVIPEGIFNIGSFIVKILFLEKENLHLIEIPNIFVFKVFDKESTSNVSIHKLEPRPIKPLVKWSINNI